MKKRLWLRLASACLLPVFSFLPISPAHSATVGSGNCVQNLQRVTGVSVTTYSNRCVVKFTSSTANTWTVPRGVTKVWVLVVGGGGGGGSDEGGGGGGGGYLERTSFSVTSEATIALSVGAGGAGASNVGGGTGSDGGDSIFGTLTAIGGGGAGSAINASSVLKDGRDGGSGGGGAGEGGTYRLGTGGSATSGQGFAGGAGYTGRGGGGGGAAEVGNADGASMGGDGKSTLILDGATSTYFAGGGGGGGGNYGTNLSVVGGAGGGGAGGGGTTCPVDGTVSTGGGGGGGASASCSDYDGANGGSGVIIINYEFDITAPQVTSSTTQSIAENTSTSTSVLTIKINESTTAAIASGQDSADFTLIYSDSVTSLLRFAAIPDFENPLDVGLDNVYNFTLNLEDYSGNTSTQAFIITVTDINEAPTITASSGSDSISYTVAENTSALYNINATDQDAGTTLTYSLTGTDAADFTISSTGVLSFNPAVDFEDARDSNGDNVYIVIAWVSDGALSDSQTATITVTNLNESGTVSTPSLSAAAYKGITVTISVSLNAHGKVLFTANGKRIPNCLAVRTTGTYPSIAATCSWKPIVTGRINVQAALTPSSNTFSASSSERLGVWVTKRSTTR